MGERGDAWNRHCRCLGGAGLDDDHDGRQATWNAAELSRLLPLRGSGLCFFDPLAFFPRTEFADSNAVMGSRDDLHDDLGNLYSVCLAVWWFAANAPDDFHLDDRTLRLVAESGRATPGEYDGRNDLLVVGMGPCVSVGPSSALGLLGWHGPRRSHLLRRCVLPDV